MTARRKFSAEDKREVVAMLDTLGVTVSQISTELGIGANVLGVGDAVAPPARAGLRGQWAIP